jgi:hypothetical protein
MLFSTGKAENARTFSRTENADPESIRARREELIGSGCEIVVKGSRGGER